jgi:hypothetical protein
MNSKTIKHRRIGLEGTLISKIIIMDQLRHIYVRQNPTSPIRNRINQRWVHLNSLRTSFLILRSRILKETWTLNKKRREIINLVETSRMMLHSTAYLQARHTSTTIITTSTVKVSRISRHSWGPLKMSITAPIKWWSPVEAPLSRTTTSATTVT